MSPPGGLVIRGVSKTFTGQAALVNVSVDFPAGTVTALLGHNGSGKSTLIKILAGFYEPDAGGEIEVNGRPLPLPISPQDSEASGLRFMHQDLGLVEGLSIADNFAFASRFDTRGLFAPISRRREHARVRRQLELLNIDEDPERIVKKLDPTTKTMVAMARAVQDSGTSDEAKGHILCLDEPTAALPADEVDRVLGVLRTIRGRGGAVILVSHRIDEVLQIADRVLILREGKVVAERDCTDLNSDTLVSLVLGGVEAKSKANSRRKASTKEVVLSAKGLSGQRLREVTLELQRGEIVGVAGLVGCGRSELARILAGAQRAIAGTTTLAGAPYRPKTPAEALASGVAYVPQDRRRVGCIAGMSLQSNLSLGALGNFFRGGWLRLSDEHDATIAVAQEFDIQPPEPRRLLAYFSGGNQQKAVLGRAVGRDPRLLVLDEPMQGIDVGARAELARIVKRLAEQGVSILVGASDNADLVGLCDRVLVLNRGELVGALVGEEITEQRLTVLSAKTLHGTPQKKVSL